MSQRPKSDPYSRFIPREEIDGVAAWHFSAVDGSDPRPALRGDLDAKDQNRMQAEREKAFEEGYQLGHDAGAKSVRDAMEASMRRTAEETGVRMAHLLKTTAEQLKASEQHISRHILDLACDLARQVVRRELQQQTDHLVPVINEALTQLIDDGLPATVRMNPDDLALMRGVLQESLAHAKPTFVADSSVSPGGCLVESSATTVDATIEKRWLRAVGNLGLQAAWNPQDTDV